MELTVRDAAGLCDVTEDTVYQWIETGGLPARKVAGRLRLNREELVEWATTSGVRVSPNVLNSGDERSHRFLSVAEALEQGGVHHDVGGDDKPSVLHAVVKLIHLPKTVQREFLLQVLMAREALGSTGVGEGIAIPHPRNPIVLNVAQPLVSLHFLNHPVDFDALDGKPVDTLFMIISPTIRMHLHVLSTLAFFLHDPAIKILLKQKAAALEILAEMRRAERVFQQTKGIVQR
jgi:nitrogen PTS system EIIA component